MISYLTSCFFFHPYITKQELEALQYKLPANDGIKRVEINRKMGKICICSSLSIIELLDKIGYVVEPAND